MVFASICEYVSSAFIFASTRSDQFSHARSEHVSLKLQMASSEHFVNFPVPRISLLYKTFCAK